MISELGYFRSTFFPIPSASQCRSDVKTKPKIICLPTKPLKTCKKICLNSVERVSAFQIELVESDSVEKIFNGRPFLCHYHKKVQKTVAK